MVYRITDCKQQDTYPKIKKILQILSEECDFIASICICAKKNPAILGYVVRKERGKSIFTHFDSIDPERRAAFLLTSESFMNLHLLTSSSSLACISTYLHV